MTSTQTNKEIKELFLKSSYPSNMEKTMMKLGIIKVRGAMQSSLDHREYRVFYHFNYFNPLTYLYVVPLSLVIFLYNTILSGVKETIKQMKRELIDDFQTTIIVR